MKRNTDGLTILELLIAFAIIAVAFIALAFTQITGFKVSRDAQGTAIARDLASEKIEVVRGYGFDDFSSCPATNPSDAPITCSGYQKDSNHPGYTVSWQITNQPAGIPTTLSSPALVGVTVITTWSGGSYTLGSYLSCGDAGDLSSTNVTCPPESLR